MGLKSSSTGGGEIVQVQGGHIIRATGRKDRHSKVFTAKGPRDRRVRLSAHTAIQFYDVQDRLGYDRPSKAVDWLMKKAKASIDKLAELPPWDPTAAASTTAVNDVNGGGCTEFHVGDHSGSSSFYAPQLQCVDPHHSLGGSDSMKSFFPMNDDTNHGSGENSISFQNYPHELISRGGAQNQDLCLSLHTLQDPSGGARGGSGHHHQNSGHDSTLFNGSGSSLGFDGGPGGWVETHHQHDLGRFSRMLGWPMGASAGAGGGAGTGGGGDTRGENFFNPPPFPPQGLLLGQQGPISTTTYSQRGTLRSSFSPLVRVLEDQQHQRQHQHQHQPEIPNMGHASDGFMGFYIPSQVHGHELHDGANSMSNKASSSSLSPDSNQH